MRAVAEGGAEAAQPMREAALTGGWADCPQQLSRGKGLNPMSIHLFNFSKPPLTSRLLYSPCRGRDPAAPSERCGATRQRAQRAQQGPRGALGRRILARPQPAAPHLPPGPAALPEPAPPPNQGSGQQASAAASAAAACPACPAGRGPAAAARQSVSCSPPPGSCHSSAWAHRRGPPSAAAGAAGAGRAILASAAAVPVGADWSPQRRSARCIAAVDSSVRTPFKPGPFHP